MRSLLDHQADGIEYTLHTHGIDASVAGGNISPRLIQFHIKLGAGAKYNRVAALADELAVALSVTHCRITRDGYFVKIEVPRPDPQAVQLFPLMRNLPGDLPFNSPVLGLDESGVPLLLRLEAPDISHILISGGSGSGKSVLSRSMIASLALQNQPDQLKLLLIDAKGRSYRDFNGLPNLVCPVVTDPADGLHRLKWAVRHLEKREESGLNSPVLVIFIDELADLQMVNAREVEYLLSRLTHRGRETGIHLVATAQKPATSALANNGKVVFPTRLVGRVGSAEEARVASGVAGSGAEKLMGQGDFLLFAKGEITRVQAAHLSLAEMRQTVLHLGGKPEHESAPAEASRTAAAQPAKRSWSAGRPIEPAAAPPRKEFKRRQAAFDPEPDAQPPLAGGYKGQSDPARRRAQIAGKAGHSAEAVEGLGVADRLERYKADIQRRRAQLNPDAALEDTGLSEDSYYNPARVQRSRPISRVPEPVSPARPSPRSDYLDDLDDEEDLASNEFYDDEEDEVDFDPREDERPGPPPFPRPIPKGVPGVTRLSSQLDGRNLIDSLKTRNSGSFKIGS